MRSETYARRMRALTEKPRLLRGMILLEKLVAISMFAAYPLLLVYLFSADRRGFLQALILPACGFALVSLARMVIDRPRPYEVFGTASAIPKETRGRSFPSRHVYSAVLISLLCLFMLPQKWIGGLLLAAAALMGAIRVFGGVHFVTDVLTGALLGVLTALLACR